MITGQFSLGGAGLRFLLVGFGGVGLGLLVGLIMRWVQGRLDDPPVQITISLLTPFAAYLLAERLEVSGVLAVVAAGMYWVGIRPPSPLAPGCKRKPFGRWPPSSSTVSSSS
jgi:CPA1 family monovalent cation:H+ antiporter